MIRMKDIRFQYGKKPLFAGLDLEIPKGNIYGLLGMNGAGKTTLLKLFSGQLFPLEGTARVLGYDPVRRSPDMLCDLFHLPEEFLLPRMRADEYLKINAPFYPRFDHEALHRYCNEFGLDLTQKLNELSFGQKKKFLLSFGLASNTSLLILDEPTNGLDIPSKSQFRRTVASAMTEDRTFIISTHQVRDMENLIDPIIIIHEGKVVFHNDMESVSERLVMNLEHMEPHANEVLYSEKVPGGWMTIRERKDDETETQVDLETLFNAVITHSQAFADAMKGGRS
ncbi:MAG: ABC transporter ATP-binding protein [Sphaerochaetaceae bacterium]|jgi:ABC-2 type transport system ATP-binding protein|nr:ABC transporter ATP-binding protein [Sphaerochaetaceae bacterium]MDD3941857.1 ABC transporter ATP-binding protein [Sphaerochaetaceae bacterium]MDX9938372.1 ABC transporter ATP-binding protein [Sphaerochaetaceae bacterium]